MSETRADVDDADRLARVTLSRTIEPGDLRVTGLVSEIGAAKGLGYLEDQHVATKRGIDATEPNTASRMNPSSAASALRTGLHRPEGPEGARRPVDSRT